jgi:uncharacterized membrane protein YedE/YeeE
MTVEGFTPVSALLGGALIGLAAAALYAATGRIAGISGVAGDLLRTGARADAAWRLLFLAGLVVGAGAVALVGDAPELRIEASWPVLVPGGLLVGYGTQLGRGCTSGHGVCGNSRFEVRSLVATVTFMLTGALAVFLARVWS